MRGGFPLNVSNSNLNNALNNENRYGQVNYNSNNNNN